MASPEALIAALGQENQTLRRRLSGLVARVRNGEEALRRLQSQEIELLACDSLSGLLRHLHERLPRCFGWEEASLLLHDPEYQVRRLMEQAGENPAEHRGLIFLHDPDRLHTLFEGCASPRLGPFVADHHGDLFPGAAAPPSDVALLPLERYGRIFGSLNVGGFRPERLPQEGAAGVLGHLAAVVAICLETAILRERQQHLGLTDGLTGVNNRRFFDQRLPEEVARGQRARTPLSCLLIGLDRFRPFNDAHGHQAGDQVLRAVAGAARAVLRRADVLARREGDGFAVLLPQTGRTQALEIAQRLRGRLEDVRPGAGGIGGTAVTISVGVATLEPVDAPRDPAGLGGRLLEAASRGLRRAKDEGRNRVAAEEVR